MPKTEACEVVIATIDKASKVLDKGFLNKVNVSGTSESDFSGPITIPLQQLLRFASTYFKAVKAGHGNKKAVKALGKQLESSAPSTTITAESFRAVEELLKPKT